MIFFEPSTWPQATIGLSPSVLQEVKSAALILSSELPAKPTVDHLPEKIIVEKLALLDQAVTRAREQSVHPEHWPESGIPEVNLVLWAMGLSTHLLLTRKRES